MPKATRKSAYDAKNLPLEDTNVPEREKGVKTQTKNQMQKFLSIHLWYPLYIQSTK